MAKEYLIVRPNSMDSGWSLWRRDQVTASGEDLQDLVKGQHDVVVAVPVAYCTSFFQALPTQDELYFDDMVLAQIEMRGLGNHDGQDVPNDYHVVEKKDGRTLLSIDVLSSDLPETWCVSSASGYLPSARLLAVPAENDVMLWWEHGHPVLAGSMHDRITSAVSLSASDKLDEALAQEVNLLVLSLQAEGSLGENPRLVLLGDCPKEERTQFEKSLVMSVDYHPESAPRIEPGALERMEKLLPLPVQSERLGKQRRNKRNAVLMAVGVMYVLVGTLLWLYAQGKKNRIEALEQQVDVNRPEVRKIKEAAVRWQELEPAFDLKRYPLVQLNEVTRLMPPTGVLIREFETKGSSIRIRGQARDAQIAYQFEEDLKSSEFLSQYRWNMPKPELNKDNTATFEVQGELNYAESE